MRSLRLSLVRRVIAIVLSLSFLGQVPASAASSGSAGVTPLHLELAAELADAGQWVRTRLEGTRI